MATGYGVDAPARRLSTFRCHRGNGSQEKADGICLDAHASYSARYDGASFRRNGIDRCCSTVDSGFTAQSSGDSIINDRSRGHWSLALRGQVPVRRAIYMVLDCFKLVSAQVVEQEVKDFIRFSPNETTALEQTTLQLATIHCRRLTLRDRNRLTATPIRMPPGDGDALPSTQCKMARRQVEALS